MHRGWKVRVTRDSDKAGARPGHDLLTRRRQPLGLGPHVITLSAGGTTRKDLPLLSFVAFWDTYRHYKSVVLVAPAGNNSTRLPFWPPAFPEVAGVGALVAKGGARAYFRDFTPWCDGYRPGDSLVPAHV